ncbi:MAG TPA: hypothetical protein VFF07_16715 [Actinomycetota bacterium]|nr:hypothetical protein [Actinomycetota bacterium]
MRFAFKELPGTSEDFVRPVVPVVVEGLPRAPQLCLLDTGSLQNRFGLWVAQAAGIDLEFAPAQTLALGGFQTIARTVPVRLAVGDAAWEAPVSFCDPWPLSFHLLGQEGFFRWFRVTIRAARYTMDLVLEQK